jgi:hypothetical protein
MDQSGTERSLLDQERYNQNVFFNKTFTDMSQFQRSWYLVEPNLKNMADNAFVIFVQSSLLHIEKRNRIRATWGNSNYYRKRNMEKPIVFFTCGLESGNDVISEAARKEIITHGDLLILKMVDSYDNLTFKGLLTMQWVLHKTDPSVKYVIKTDDDVMLNTFRFMSLVESPFFQETPKFILGYVWQSPDVNRKGRYAVSLKEYAGEYYPAFCTGSGYVMSREAMEVILKMTPRVQFLKRDDPLITGILAAAGHVARYSFNKETYILYPFDFLDDLSWETTMLVHDAAEPLWHHIWQTYVAYAHPVLSSGVQTDIKYITSEEFPEEEITMTWKYIVWWCISITVVVVILAGVTKIIKKYRVIFRSH